ncbi:hypothetical protein OPV22_032465 [Ensete ventricosum]|uniref:Uncharacterized protein n=1 Tax=Ensete ventricosum TaxID=4639 RepID=A0AAV8PZD0_ENSVE|nr:hypothetical protein OPV22_032465 [Ensete ventricosum]
MVKVEPEKVDEIDMEENDEEGEEAKMEVEKAKGYEDSTTGTAAAESSLNSTITKMPIGSWSSHPPVTS